MSDRILLAIFSMAMIGIVPHPAAADLPDDVTVGYFMHEVPENAESAIVFSTQLDLTAVDSDGDWVGWGISSAVFTEVGTPPSSDRTWEDTSAVFSTPDGLWWVEHEDTSAPRLSEFLIPPRLSGTATADDNSYEDLDYELEGHSPGPRQGPYAPTAFLDYLFQEKGKQDPIEEEEDEPAEPIGVEDPY
jgi:hypothetical protein